ncbi:MAG: hypothetical protein V9F03_16300 [Microthrixaceae bacterium]
MNQANTDVMGGDGSADSGTGSDGPGGTRRRTSAHRRMLAAGLTAGVLAGGSAGVILGTPLFASAQDGSTTTTAAPEPEGDAPATPDDSRDDSTESTTTAPDSTVPEASVPPAETPTTTVAPDSSKGTTDAPADSHRADRLADRKAKQVERLQGLLKGLVEDGTITQAQADSVIEKLTKATEGIRGERGGRGGHGGGLFGKGMGDSFDAKGMMRSFDGMRQAYEALGLTPGELAQQMLDGKSLADIAREKGVDPQTLIDAAVNPVRERLDKALADGSITRGEADKWIADATKMATDAINGEWAGGHFRRRGGD